METTPMSNILRALVWLFELAADRIPLNICKVFTVAGIAGFAFSVCCLDGETWHRALLMALIFGVAAAFFGMLAFFFEEMEDDEDDI